jgi:O-antigen ligase
MTVFSPATVQRAYKVIAGLLFLTYSVFMIGYFILPDYNLQYKVYIRPLYFLVLPGIVILAAAFKEIKNHPLFQLIIVYMLYMLASGLWSTPFELYKFGQKLTNATFILSFVILTHFLRTWYQAGFDRMLRFSVLFAAVSASVSLFVFYNDNPFTSARVRGLGSLTNVNEFANVYGVYALLAMAYALKARFFRERALFLFLVIIFIGFIWFGQSRTALLSLLMALCLLVITDGRQEKIKLIVLLVSVVGALGLAFPEALEQAWNRGGGLRPGIWQAHLKDVAQAPIFGRGIISAFSYDIDEYSFATAHNAYIQTLWHGGVIGLGLLLLLIASACWHAWRLGKEQGDYLVFSILLFTMAAMLTGVDTLVERPRDQWMLFWFPLALLISYQSTDRQLSRQHSGGRK